MKLTKKQLRELLHEETKSNEIIERLRKWGIEVCDREWRSFVRNFNNNYSSSGLYIASGKNGYSLTTKKNEIKKSAFNKFKTGLSMIRNAKTTLKELEDHNQLTLSDQNEVDIYETMMSFKVK